jgi:hypothetical protein
MTQKWALLCPYLTDTAGHEAEYVERLGATATGQGHAVRVIGPRNSHVNLEWLSVERPLPALRVERPTRNLTQRLVQKGARYFEHLTRLRAYCKIFQDGDSTTNWLLHTATLPEIAIVVSAFKKFQKKRDIGRLKIIVRADHHDDPLRIRQFRATLSAAGPSVDIYTDTRELAEMAASLAGRPVGVVPVPGTPPLERPLFPRAVLFGYFGLRRISKGYDRLPDILDALPHVNDGNLWFRAIVHDSSTINLIEDHRVATAAILARGGTLCSERLSGAEYAEALSHTDVAVMPYSVKEYRFGSSGVFVDALHAGCAVIVPEGTWMAKETRRHDLQGVFIADFDRAASISTAASKAIEFRVNQTVAPVNAHWLEENSPKGLFRALARHIAS